MYPGTTPASAAARPARLYYGWAVLLVAAAAMVGTLPGRTQGVTPTAPGITITGARIVDGSGSPPRIGSVRVEGDRIVAVGDVAPATGDTIVDGKGLALAPGFIDIHNHSTSGLDAESRRRDAGRAGHHDAGRRRRRLVAVADRRVSGRAAGRAPPPST